MATVTLGNIKLNWKGAYNAGTAYAIDDVVSYNGSSYVAKTATTGNLPTVTANWDLMSQAGTNGTDGTDLTSTLTTQGDIVYRDGSGLARLGAGTSGQVLQTGGTGANPSWGTVSSDWVKINHTDSTSAVSSHELQGIFDDSIYDGYKILLHTELPDQDYLNARFMSGSTVLSGSTDYRKIGHSSYRKEDHRENVTGNTSDVDGRDNMDITNWNFSDATGNAFFNEMIIFGALEDTSNYKALHNNVTTRDNSGGGSGDYFARYTVSFMYLNYSQSVDGIKFYTANGGNFERFKISIYGMKK